MEKSNAFDGTIQFKDSLNQEELEYWNTSEDTEEEKISNIHTVRKNKKNRELNDKILKRKQLENVDRIFEDISSLNPIYLGILFNRLKEEGIGKKLLKENEEIEDKKITIDASIAMNEFKMSISQLNMDISLYEKDKRQFLKDIQVIRNISYMAGNLYSEIDRSIQIIVQLEEIEQINVTNAFILFDFLMQFNGEIKDTKLIRDITPNWSPSEYNYGTKVNIKLGNFILTKYVRDDIKLEFISLKLADKLVLDRRRPTKE